MALTPSTNRTERITVGGSISRFLDITRQSADLLGVAPGILEFARDRGVVVVTHENLLDLRRIRGARRLGAHGGHLDVRFLDDRGHSDRILFRPTSGWRLDRALRRSGWQLHLESVRVPRNRS
jgi:hypothetical protein